MSFEHLKPLIKTSNSKIVLLVLDGLGGLPIKPGGPTELEAAHTPNMDRLASQGTLGQIVPIRPGVTPGSGPAHLALFGYDPLTYLVGRGALEATGIGMQLNPGDVAARGNLCTLDKNGVITDRRAGRISSVDALPLIEQLNEIEIAGVETEVKHLREYRFTVLMRGEGLAPNIADTDPQQTGLPPRAAKAQSPDSTYAADLFDQWITATDRVLSGQPAANGLTLRGFGTDPILPKFQDIYSLNAACVAVYPMYRGVSKLVGMQLIDFPGESPAEQFSATENIWGDFDFFFIHIKKTDSRGEDGDFTGKAEVIEAVDLALPQLLDLNPDVIIITGDHSTPSKMRAHSWHPVPLLLWSPQFGLRDQQSQFGERACALGGQGTFPATDLMPFALAHGGRLNKFGA